MNVVALEKGDIQKAAGILRDYWTERGMEYSQKWTESYLLKGHSKEIKDDVTLVLKEGEEIIGVVAVVVYEGDLAEVRDWVVRKEYRKKGYGKLLLKEAIEFCIKRNVRKIAALVFPQYEKLFEKIGFLREGYLRSHFKDNEDLVYMSVILQQREMQANLRTQLQDLSIMKDIESETSERLRMMKSKRQV